MLVINNTLVTVHNKRGRSENTMQEKRVFSLELEMTLTSSLRARELKSSLSTAKSEQDSVLN